MTQGELNIAAALAHRYVLAQPDLFREGFAAWLSDNWKMYQRFERIALDVNAHGRRHYGANSIIEVIRYQTVMADASDEFKVDDRWTSSMARLCVLMNPFLRDFFEFRERRRDGVVKMPPPRPEAHA